MVEKQRGAVGLSHNKLDENFYFKKNLQVCNSTGTDI